MWEFLQSLLDIILPRKERVVRIGEYTIEDLLVSPQEHVVNGQTITTLTSYRTQLVEDLIRALKYDHATHARMLLADTLAEYLREEIASLKTFSARPIVLVPVPLHPSRVRERGFNQVIAMLDALPNEFRDGSLSRIEAQALVRTRPTQQQTRLSRAERIKNVANAFALSKPESIRDAHMILIDDVTTTGATLLEAARPFAGAVSSYSLLAFAHA